MCVEATSNVGASVPLVLALREPFGGMFEREVVHPQIRQPGNHLPAIARSTSSPVCGSFAVRLINLPSWST